MICVDASLAAKWVLPEEYSKEALALYRASANAGESIVAPTLLPYEVTNILRLRTSRAALSLADARTLLTRFLAFPVLLQSSSSLHERALNLAARFDLPATYDAHYLALAEQAACPFWTDDRRLLRQLNGRAPYARWIGDYREATP
ncbi:MAG TPA: type II toxin-antitoxin system VapC family toxin [Chloroflexota bacterium]|nr:type II toxin-antitoxin system VapC family toxin [Chloroflexota bacterium]